LESPQPQHLMRNKAKLEQIGKPGGTARQGGQLCKTNPICRRSGYPTIPLFYHSSIPIRCRLCETKPNLGRMEYLGDGAWGANCAERSQFRGVRLGPEGEMCKTNPISEEVSSVKYEVLSPASRASSRRSLLTSDFTLQTFGGTPAAPGRMCKTKPISEGVSRVKRRVSSESCKTNPICPPAIDSGEMPSSDVLSCGSYMAQATGGPL